jgi:adenosylcobinamide-GDP ribazoletransferase
VEGPAGLHRAGRQPLTVAEALRLVAVALGFLTRIPVPRVRTGPGDLRRASALFPAVGLLVAGVGVAVRAAAAPLWGRGVATVAAVAAMVLVTGAFHEDGLADTADGLWGGWDPAERLRIMHDSRLGTYGLVALATVLGLRVALLLPLDLAGFARAVACGHVLGRASTLLLVRRLPAAAPGSGSEVVGPLGAAGTAAAVAVTGATVGLAAGWWWPVPVAAGLLACGLCERLFRRRLGGVTGDALGAANQLTDLAAVAAVAALVRAGRL